MESSSYSNFVLFVTFVVNLKRTAAQEFPCFYGISQHLKDVDSQETRAEQEDTEGRR